MKNFLLKKLLAISLLATLLAGLSATATFAAAPTCKPGCYCTVATGTATDGTSEYGGFFGLQESHANTMRLRDRAYARQIQHQNDNSMGMTCFDHALALTGHLGQVFSDVHPAGAQPPNNTQVFGTSTFPNYGSDQYLATDLNVLVAPTLKAHAAQFPDSISSQLGATVLNFMATFMGPINAIINQILAYMNTLNTLVNNLKTLMNFFQGLIRAMNLEPAMILVAWVNGVVIPAFTVAQAAVRAAIQTLLTTVNGLISGMVSSLLMGATSTLSNYGTPLAPSPQNDCARIENLWGVPQGFSFPASMLNGADLRSLTGTGRQPGTAYFNFKSLLTMAPAGTGAWAGTGGTSGTELKKELSLVANTNIITRATTDTNSGGALNPTTVGASPTLGSGAAGIWPTIPAPIFTVPTNATNNTAAIITAMGTP